MVLNVCWPGPVSIILPCTAEKWAHLHKGKGTLAFRCPRDMWLSEILRETGPLVAPSANPEGENPAKTIEEAQNYFGDSVKCYINDGNREGEASTLIKIAENKLEILREGAFEEEELQNLWENL